MNSNNTNNNTRPKAPAILTLESLYADFLPHLTHSATKLFLYHYLQSQHPNFNNKLDLLKFCQETNTSDRTAYRALHALKKQKLIPDNTVFINTYDPNK